MNTPRQIPATENDGWGFFGTMDQQAGAAWPLAMTSIAEATGEPLESIRLFLDSRHGRHFADDVLNQLFAGHSLPIAVAAATRQWMDWKIEAQTSKSCGFP